MFQTCPRLLLVEFLVSKYGSPVLRDGIGDPFGTHVHLYTLFNHKRVVFSTSTYMVFKTKI